MVLNGVGSFPNTHKSQSSNSTEISTEHKNIPEQINLFDENRIDEENRLFENKFEKKSNTPILERRSPASEIEKIIVFTKTVRLKVTQNTNSFIQEQSCILSFYPAFLYNAALKF